MRKQSIVIRPPALDAVEAQRIKATLGITGWYRPSVHSDGDVRHLDVGSPYPGGGEAPKGLAVRQLKRYASWVQTVEKRNLFQLLNPFEPTLNDINRVFSSMKKKRDNNITATIRSDVYL